MNIMISNHFWILNSNNQWVHPKIEEGHINIKEYELFKFDKYIKGSNRLVHNTKGIKEFHNTNYYYFYCDATNVFIYDSTLGSNGYLQLIVRPHISGIEMNHIIEYLGNLDNDLPVSFIRKLSKYFNIKLNCGFFDNKVSHKVSLMIKYLNRIIIYFRDLCSNKMDFSLQKYYDESFIPKRSDSKSVKLNILSDSRFKKYNPDYYLTYDISANRFIKQILKSVIYFINQGINRIRYNLDGINNYYNYYIKHKKYNYYYDCDKQECVKCINFFKVCSNRLKFIDRKFLSRITNKKMLYPPKKILMSFKYNIIYKYYLKIKNIKFYLNSDYIIEQSGKRNCYLYEVWTYFALLNILKESKYTLINHPKHPIQYFLNHGINFDFSKKLSDSKYIRLNAVYNIKLNKYNKGMPLIITGKHYNPDIVLDISLFDNNKKYYLGTIIMDAKCMYREAVPCIHKNMLQFLDYIDKAHLSYYGKYEIVQKQGCAISYNDYNPVNAVFALYPISSIYPNKFNCKETRLNKCLIYQRLNPLKKSDLTQFKSRLLKGIKYCLIVHSNLSLKDILKIKKLKL